MDHSGGDQDSEASHHLTESHAAPSDAGGEDLTGELEADEVGRRYVEPAQQPRYEPEGGEVRADQAVPETEHCGQEQEGHQRRPSPELVDDEWDGPTGNLATRRSSL